jgi:hypothetical protein
MQMDAEREEDWDLWLSRSLARLDEENGPPPPWRAVTEGKTLSEGDREAPAMSRLNFTAQERRIIGAALQSMEGTACQPATEDLSAAGSLLQRGLLVKRDGWDVLDATPEAQEMYWADRDDLDEQDRQHRLHAKRL